jgi:glycosyltransferase involved in cell wall biosynthesis
MATYNGGRFLTPQLESIREQTIAEIDVLASDDGSTDDTSSILESFAANWPKGRFDIVRGPGQGFADNFRGGVRPAV